MKRVRVESSDVESIGHNGTLLEVEFKTGAVYQYANVPAPIYEAIATAPSVGRALNLLVKKNPKLYPYVRVE